MRNSASMKFKKKVHRKISLILLFRTVLYHSFPSLDSFVSLYLVTPSSSNIEIILTSYLGLFFLFCTWFGKLSDQSKRVNKHRKVLFSADGLRGLHFTLERDSTSSNRFTSASAQEHTMDTPTNVRRPLQEVGNRRFAHKSCECKIHSSAVVSTRLMASWPCSIIIIITRWQDSPIFNAIQLPSSFSAQLRLHQLPSTRRFEHSFLASASNTAGCTTPGSPVQQEWAYCSWSDTTSLRYWTCQSGNFFSDNNNHDRTNCTYRSQA